LEERLAAGKSNPGLFIVPQRRAIAEVIESLLLVWSASQAAEWRDAIIYINCERKTSPQWAASRRRDHLIRWA
jgi:hypothetical protein